MENEPLYHFGPFCLDAKERVLLRDGRIVPLAPKALSTLLVLVRNKGHVVEKDTLMAEVWPDEFVEEGNLTQHVFMVRRALGETTDEPGYIETIPRRGYRFLLPQKTNSVGGGTDVEEQASVDVSAIPHLLAVLPFSNNGGDHTHEHLSDGITESLINSLSVLPQLRVTARSAVFRFKGNSDHLNIGRELRVQFVLGGRIQVSNL
jgi:DNA-binding winged helix-turn-helix (wHTH) protein